MEEQEKKEMEQKAEKFKERLDKLSESIAENIFDYLRDNQEKPDSEVKEYIKSKIVGHSVFVLMMMTMSM